MWRVLIPSLCLLALVITSPAWADDNADCSQFTDLDRTIRACSQTISAGRVSRANLAIAYANRGFAYGQKGDYDSEIADQTRAIELDPRYASAYNNRGVAYGQKGDSDREMADETRAIELDPRLATAYHNRGFAYAQKGDYDSSITDETKAIELDPRLANAYRTRGLAYGRKGDYDHAIADETRVIELDPRSAIAYDNRGTAYRWKGDFDRAIADETKAIELDPQSASSASAYANRGFAYGAKGDYDREIADQNKAIELKEDLGAGYYGRGEAYAAKGEPAKALSDFRIAGLHLPASDERQGKALARVAELEKQLAPAAPATVAEAKPEPPPAPVKSLPAVAETRLALVIGNSGYTAVAKLPNPERDAETIATALRADGFEVTLADNLTHADFIAAINRFSDAAAKADWAVIYFAGHGLQLDGVNYLVPVDAKLAADRDVQDEAIALDRTISAVSGARKLGLVVVDACRNNPFLVKMRFTVAARAAHTRGLARVEAQGTTLVEFSAQDGQEALDGDPTGNSPFAAALAKRLAMPGLEVGKLLRQVRKDVLAATANQQQPMYTGSLPDEDVFFRAPQ